MFRHNELLGEQVLSMPDQGVLNIIQVKVKLLKKTKSVGMTLAKVKEQDGILLANVKVPSIPTSAACFDDMQLTNAESSSYTFYNFQLLNRIASSKTQIPLVIYNCQLLHRTASS